MGLRGFSSSPRGGRLLGRAAAASRELRGEAEPMGTRIFPPSFGTASLEFLAARVEELRKEGRKGTHPFYKESLTSAVVRAVSLEVCDKGGNPPRMPALSRAGPPATWK